MPVASVTNAKPDRRSSSSPLICASPKATQRLVIAPSPCTTTNPAWLLV